MARYDFDVKTLYAMRHAKSSWNDANLDDFDRPLAPRGAKAARRVGRFLEGVDPRPTFVLCSTATRAVETYEALAGRLSYTLSTSFRDDLYGASAASMLEIVSNAPDDVTALLLIGHNPGVQDFVAGLTSKDERIDAEQLRDHFPTAALAKLTVRGRWSDLGDDGATLESFVIPRALEN